MRLKNGDKIAVIGGGPAGSFFAHFALQYAKLSGIDISVTIFEKKDFAKKGIPGCNMSAGVLSETLLKRLSDQGIQIPSECIQHEIEGYFLRVPECGVPLHYPYATHKTRIVTVFRGSGPRFADCNASNSFDYFLLKHVERRGGNIVLSPVIDVRLPGNTKEPVTLLYGDENSRTEFKADLVVGAFGVNSDTLYLINKLGFGYVPPKTIRTCLLDCYPTRKVNDSLYGNNIYVFSIGVKDIKFAAFIPKGDFLTICLVGSKNMNTAKLNAFLNQPIIQKMLPKGWDDLKKRCVCFPRIPVNHARHPYTNRFVIIGDAAISRTYKNGIDSAFINAQLVAKIAFERGISEKDFCEGYFEPSRKLMGRDNIYGLIILTANDMLSRQKFIVSQHIKYMSEHPDTWETERMNEVLWNTVTGNATYRDIFFKSTNPRLLSRLCSITLGFLIKRLMIWRIWL